MERSRRRPSTARCSARRSTRSSRRSAWSSPIMCRSARSAPGTSSPIPKGRRRRSAPRWRCSRCGGRCVASSDRPTSFAIRRPCFACSSRRPNRNASPFDLTLATAGDDFAVMGMHFKLGLYEHQSAGAIQGVIDLIADQPSLVDDPAELRSLRITIYEPAFSIIGDPAKRDPQTRQSADHSMLYIIATLLRKAYEARRTGWDGQNGWQRLMLVPDDYAEDDSGPLPPAHPRADGPHRLPPRRRRSSTANTPTASPRSSTSTTRQLGKLTSGLVMYPEGHARSTSGNLPRCWTTSSACWPGWASTTPNRSAKRFTETGRKIAARSRGDLRLQHLRRILTTFQRLPARRLPPSSQCHCAIFRSKTGEISRPW